MAITAKGTAAQSTIKTATRIVGIDIAKAHLDIFILENQKHFQLPNHREGFKTLVTHLRAHPNTQVIFEATGRYHKALEAALAKVDMAYTMVNPWQARNFAKATGKRAKTDKLDAHMLALMGSALQLDPTIKRDEVFEMLGECELMRLALKDQRAAYKNREQILTAPSLKRLIGRQIRQLDKELASLNAQMLGIIKDHEELAERLKILASIPGLGPTSALSILITMPELGTLNAKQVGALAGLAPIDQQSGKWIGQSKICAGRAPLRKALFMPALLAARYNPDLTAFYKRLLEAGKPKMVATTAVMRKLLVTANALVRKNETWVPN